MGGVFYDIDGQERDMVMTRYDKEPWEFIADVKQIEEVATLLVYHVRLSHGQDFWLPHMTVRIEQADLEQHVFDVVGQTGYKGNDAEFAFRVKVECASLEMALSE